MNNFDNFINKKINDEKIEPIKINNIYLDNIHYSKNYFNNNKKIILIKYLENNNSKKYKEFINVLR